MTTKESLTIKTGKMAALFTSAVIIATTTTVASAAPTSVAPLPLKPGLPEEFHATQDLPNKIWVKPDVTQSDDGRFTIAPSEFSIVPPDAWTIRENIPGQSLVLEAPDTNNNYHGTLQVRLAEGPRYLDNVGIEEFKAELKQKLGSSGGTLPDFTIRNSEIVNLDDNRESLLVYSSFSFNGVELLQAHLLLSNDDHHAVVTYTDLASQFESNAEGSPLATAWQAMTTSKLPGTTPSRFAGPIQLAALAGVVLVIGGILFSLRNSLAKQSYSKAANLSIEGMSDLTTGGPDPLSGSDYQPSALSDFKELSGEDLLETAVEDSTDSKQAA